MGLFCWKKCQERRTERQSKRQESRTERVQIRNQSKSIGYVNGINPLAESIQSGANLAGNLANLIPSTGLSGTLKNLGLENAGSVVGGSTSESGTSAIKNLFLPFAVVLGVILIFVNQGKKRK